MGYVNGNLNLTVSADLSGVADKPTQDEILGLLKDADGDKLMLIKNILSSQNDSFVSLVSTINAMQNDLNTVKNNITESGIDIDSAQNIKDALTNAGIAVGDNATLQEIIASLDQSIVNPQDLRNALSALGVSVSASDTIPQLVAKMASVVTLAAGSQDANATASQILSGYSAYVKGTKVNGSVPSLGAQTITPGTTAKTIPAGRYLSGLQTIAGDANLIPANIKKGLSIFGITGTYEGAGGAYVQELPVNNGASIDRPSILLPWHPDILILLLRGYKSVGSYITDSQSPSCSAATIKIDNLIPSNIQGDYKYLSMQTDANDYARLYLTPNVSSNNYVTFAKNAPDNQDCFVNLYFNNNIPSGVS